MVLKRNYVENKIKKSKTKSEGSEGIKLGRLGSVEVAALIQL